MRSAARHCIVARRDIYLYLESLLGKHTLNHSQLKTHFLLHSVSYKNITMVRTLLHLQVIKLISADQTIHYLPPGKQAH